MGGHAAAPSEGTGPTLPTNFHEQPTAIAARFGYPDCPCSAVSADEGKVDRESRSGRDDVRDRDDQREYGLAALADEERSVGGGAAEPDRLPVDALEGLPRRRDARLGQATGVEPSALHAGDGAIVAGRRRTEASSR